VFTSLPGLYSLIPRPLLHHSQAFTVSFPGLYSLIPRPLLPHSQAFTVSFPGLYCLIPRPLQSHSQAFTVSNVQYSTREEEGLGELVTCSDKVKADTQESSVSMIKQQALRTGFQPFMQTLR